MNKKAIVTLAYGEHSKLLPVWRNGFQPVAEKQGYDLVTYESLVYEDVDPMFNKGAMIRNELKTYEFVIWCDVDVLPFGPDVNLDIMKLKHRITISSDYNGICAGIMGIPRSLKAHMIFETCLYLGPVKDYGEFDGRDTKDQNTLKVLMKYFEEVSDMVVPLSENVISNPNTDKISNSLIMHHFWANRGVDDTLIDMNLFLKNPRKFLEENLPVHEADQ